MNTIVFLSTKGHFKKIAGIYYVPYMSRYVTIEQYTIPIHCLDSNELPGRNIHPDTEYLCRTYGRYSPTYDVWVEKGLEEDLLVNYVEKLIFAYSNGQVQTHPDKRGHEKSVGSPRP